MKKWASKEGQSELKESQDDVAHSLDTKLILRPQKIQNHFGGEKQNESQLFMKFSKALAEGEGPVSFF